jgi:CBS domain-containing protein
MVDLIDYVVSCNGTLLDAVEVIDRNRSRCAVAVDGEKVIGVVSEGDVMRALLRGIDIRAPLGDIVQYGFRYLGARNLDKAIKLMHSSGITLVPIVDHDMRLTGVITLYEVFEELLSRTTGRNEGT